MFGRVVFVRGISQTAVAALLFVAVVGFAGCGSAGTDGGADTAPTGGGSADSGEMSAETPTYHADIAPMMDEYCGDCHKPGGIGPFSLQSYDTLKPLAERAQAEIEAGRMPPWMPDPSCRDYENERRMPASAKETFADWIDAGKPEGSPENAPETSESETTFEATRSAKLQKKYLPDREKTDDYRCFVLDFEFEKDMYVQASRVLPDAENLVHHVLVYAIEDDRKDRVLQAADEEEGPGYTCFGDPLPSDGDSSSGIPPTQVGAWVPGKLPNRMPEDVGLRVEKGSKIVMQVHYNMLEESPKEDQTGFEMKLTEERPEKLAFTRPLAILDLDIPAGDPSAVHQKTYVNYSDEPVTIQTVTGHMHLLGERIEAEIVRDNEQNACLLDIPDWDFDWQQDYKLPREDWAQIQPGEGIELTCEYDNSEQNQPTVNGEKLSPRDVEWGDGSTDEMCLLYLQRIKDWEPRPADGEQCPRLEECRSECENPDSLECLLSCEEPGPNCRVCPLGETVDCSRDACGSQLLAAQDCLEGCARNSALFAGSVGACLEDRCPEAYSDLQDCVDSEIDGGACQDAYGSCGIELGN